MTNFTARSRRHVNRKAIEGIDLEKNNSEFKYNYLRTFRLSTYSFFVSGTLMHVVYTKILPKIAPGCGYSAVFKKVLFTQTIFTVVGTSMFYFILALVEERNL